MQGLFQHAESNARANVSAQREANAGRQMPPHRKDSAAERRVAARAMGHGRPRSREARQFGIGGVNIMREYGSRSREPEAIIRGKITFRPWKRFPHGGDLFHVFVDQLHVVPGGGERGKKRKACRREESP